jgi:hypothetical protein
VCEAPWMDVVGAAPVVDGLTEPLHGVACAEAYYRHCSKAHEKASAHDGAG